MTVKTKVKKTKPVTSPLKKETIKKLRAIQKYILEEPRRFNLTFWGEIANPKEFKYFENEGAFYDVVEQKPPCGAVGCIAGNACIVGGIVKPKDVIKGLDEFKVYAFPETTPEKARKYLGITKEQADRLFFLASWCNTDFDENGEYLGWPEEFEQELNNYKAGTKGYAQVTVDRIEWFIKTGE